jgi:hypothetical protein
MTTSVYIHDTKNYDKFQSFEANRPVCKKHVKKLVADPTFAKNAKTCPILVNSNLEIIDGQHRFAACQILKLPIYYIIDPKADSNDIMIRNVQMKPWRSDDYVHFFSSRGNINYKLLIDIRDTYKISYTEIFSAIKFFCTIECKHFSDIMKRGELSIINHKKEIEEFFSIYIPTITIYEETRGKFSSRPLHLDAYIRCFAYFFIEDRVVFDIALRNLISYPPELPHYTKYESAQEKIRIIANWNPAKNPKGMLKENSKVILKIKEKSKGTRMRRNIPLAEFQKLS